MRSSTTSCTRGEDGKLKKVGSTLTTSVIGAAAREVTLAMTRVVTFFSLLYAYKDS